MLISVPPDMEALSNGELIETTATEDGLVQFHYVQDQRHAPYHIGMVIGRFYKYEQSVRLGNGYTVPFAQWVPEERSEDVARTFSETGAILNFLSTRFGTIYPWPRYTQVAAGDLLIDRLDFTGFTLLNDRFLLDARAALDESPTFTLAASLAHQWVGNMLPPDFWSESWIAGGLSAYIGLLYVREREGDDAFFQALHRLAGRYFEEADMYRRPLVWNQWDHPVRLQDAHSSAKATWIFHTLHETLGDASFWNFLQTLRRARAFSPINSDIFKQALANWSTTSYDRFFDQWVYSAGHPELHVRYRYDVVAETLVVDIAQVQEGYLVPGAFELALDLEVHTLGGSSRHTVAVNAAQEEVRLPLPMAPRFILVDPEHRYLLRVDVEQSLTAWMAQLRFATNLLDRLRAVDALEERGDDPALLVGLQSALQTQPDEAVRAAILSLIGDLAPSEATRRLLMDAYEDERPLIRHVALDALARQGETADVAVMALETAESAQSYVLQAEAVRLLAAVEAPAAEAITRAALITPSHRDRVRIAGLNAVPAVGIPTREGVQLATEHPGSGYSTELRLAAIGVLNAYAALGNRASRNAIEALQDDANHLVRTAARHALAHLTQAEAGDTPLPALPDLSALRILTRLVP